MGGSLRGVPIARRAGGQPAGTGEDRPARCVAGAGEGARGGSHRVGPPRRRQGRDRAATHPPWFGACGAGGPAASGWGPHPSFRAGATLGRDRPSTQTWHSVRAGSIQRGSEVSASQGSSGPVAGARVLVPPHRGASLWFGRRPWGARLVRLAHGSRATTAARPRCVAATTGRSCLHGGGKSGHCGRLHWTHRRRDPRRCERFAKTSTASR